jgi:hypothetical protein
LCEWQIEKWKFASSLESTIKLWKHVFNR